MDKLSELLELKQESEEKRSQMVPFDRVDYNLVDPAKEMEKAIKEDYNEVRKNLKNMIQRANRSVDNMLLVMDDAESPRMFEAASTYLKTLGELNKQLLETTTGIKEKSKQKSESVEASSTTNYVYVGSSDDLFTKISKRKQEKDITPDST